MPFVPFLGVNHHGQSTLLGCALLSAENTDTFTWLFWCLLSCMSDCAPKTIFTDQGKALQNAVEIVFLNTRHRWCLCQILKKLPGKLRGNKQYESIKSDIQTVIYDFITVPEFEERWNIMIEKHNLQSNEWLLGLYDEKQEDYNSSNSVVPCITHYAMEKQFQNAYTSTIFKEFQLELRGKIYCEMSSVKKDVCSEYEISKDLKVGEMEKSETFKVSLKHDGCDIHCSCCLFESRGILCRHAIVVLIHNKILTVPEKYIIPRWSKDIKRRHTKVKFTFDDCSDKVEACRFDKMYTSFTEIADLSADFEDKTQMVIDWIHLIENELRRDDGVWASSQLAVTDGATTAGNNVIPVAPPVKRKQTVVRKNKAKQKRTGPKRTSNTDEENIQEFQIIEGEEMGYADSAIFGTQESIVFKDSGFRSHGMHIGGSSEALPTLNFADANLTLWGGSSKWSAKYATGEYLCSS